MNQRRTMWAVCLLLLIAVAPLAQAQTDSTPNRVGFVVRVDDSDRATPTQVEIAASALRHIRQGLSEARGVRLIEQDALVSAQQRLGITLGINSTAREMQAVANLLELDRLVIVKVTVSPRFDVSLAAKVFGNDRDNTVTLAVRASGDALDNALERAVSNLLKVLLPLLVR